MLNEVERYGFAFWISTTRTDDQMKSAGLVVRFRIKSREELACTRSHERAEVIAVL